MFFNKSYRYNYVYNNGDLVTNVLFTDSIKQNGSDTVYYMNRIGVECTGTCPTITTAIATTATVIVPNMPQFLQRTIVKRSDGTVLLQDTADWHIKPNCILNEVWMFDAVNSKTAQCVSISTVSVFSTVDSLKTIIIDGTDSLLLSKRFGVIQFPNVYGKNKYYRLVGIENATTYDLYSLYGIKVPNAWDFYNFDIGDKFCTNHFIMAVYGASNNQYTDNWENVEVLTKTINSGIGYNYNMGRKFQEHYWGKTPALGYYDNSSFTNTQVSISYICGDSSMENISYPGKIIRNIISPSFSFNNIVKFGKDNLGRFYKYAGPNCQNYSNVVMPNLSIPKSYQWGSV